MFYVEENETTADVGLFIQALTDRDSYEANGFFVEADLNGDVDLSGTFDFGDLSAFSALLGDQAATVPEPATLTLLGIALSAVVLRQRRLW